MDDLTAAAAASWLGITEEAVHKAAREERLPVVAGEGPRRFTVEALEAFHQARVTGHIAALAQLRETPVSAARKVRRALDAKETGVPRPFSAKLKAMPIQWRSLFSKAELAAACAQDGCRWCKAREFGEFLGLRPVEFSAALQALFGADPCGECGPALLRPYLDVLAARVHAGDRRPPGPPPRPSESERERAREWAAQHAVTAAAAPVEGDDGKGMVQRRLKETRARLKSAERAGDRTYAAQLRQTLSALTVDASRVDGRSSLTSRPGVPRCGHALAASCSCPRIASKRATS
ncbi:helix-turn-helix domain-containing protein [Streptomyces sp. 15-116A]|uniref:helix-turn-helix domain-containing protein n=1 Tax=Streptomyces sp. 15-116A TaxID=2259035 RepID=UPI0021B4797D|nr:helix-turn-helix domain-containing protein [Streptomyces sp. 15-116A]MCT7353615.1 helix-turn-helix domain-containing protein [Streptomyces sp. 15-116A]